MRGGEVSARLALVAGRSQNARCTARRYRWRTPGWHTKANPSDESFPLVALAEPGDFSNDKCGQWITVSYNGRTVSAQVQDACATCSKGQIDLSPGAMAQLDPDYRNTGQFNAEWSFGGSDSGSGKEEQKTTTEEEQKTTWTPTPDPTPTTTPTPTPTPTPTTESSSTSESTSSSPISSSSPSSSLLPSSASLVSSASVLSASMSLSSASLSRTSSALPSSSAAIAPGTDHVVAGTGAIEDGNLSGVGNLVVSVGRLIALAVGGN